MFDKILEWDRETLIYLNNLGTADTDTFWHIITTFSSWTPLLLLIVFLVYRNYSRKEFFWILISFAMMILFLTISVFMAKEFFGRLRPTNEPEINALLRILREPRDFSFFSGHAASSFAIVGLATFYLGKKVKWAYLFFIWPLLFSYSRLYFGVHYPTDLFVGGTVGMFFALLFYKMHMRFKAPYLR